ncbi:mycofactocin biosynthesis glycosyltransferase MftF [Amycolatopsis taiwanensis]|uniref:Glycosyltransferase n=1 Tax=Amycolatopsis taiwanensis TaxID=342230 RepID=A0A9W6R8X1_9PSEU|nr:mycofactocin biosynthesis glycosyltransferase MftF [Amycolatopsis taiwanensis]GLY71418.1 putative glycosyltransferase [Amycolatopsis taiwanensis]
MRLRFDSATTVVGRALVGGSPLRVMRLSEAGLRRVEEWRSGAEVGSGTKLAKKLIAAGMAHPEFVAARWKPRDVTAVIPVRDHSEQLAGLLPWLAELAGTVVVDDGSREPVPGAAHRHPVSRGPAAARNTGWRAVKTEFVAFLDADIRPEPGWLDALLPHFEDPDVAAVAPRVRSAPGTTTLARYERARSSLDLGPAPALVRPGARVSYLPTAALVVRTSALRASGGFDENLRFGEDVDLVWRLIAGGGSVRYEPASEVTHTPRANWRAWLRQRFEYGTSAAPLARRHGRKALAPLRVSRWTALAWTGAVAGRPGTGLAVALGTAALLPRKLRRFGVPARNSLMLALRGHLGAGRFLADAVTRTWGPVAIPVLAWSKRGRLVLAAALSRHLLDWARARPAVGPLPWLLARVADDVSYGAGVWRGCLTERSAAALLPDLSDWPTRRPSPLTDTLRATDPMGKPGKR